MSLKETITQKVIEAGGRLRVRSALNPILWLCAIITAPAICLFLKWPLNPPQWLIILICAPVFAGVFGFLFLLIFDRDKLQSEDYQIRKRSLELIGEKGHDFLVNPTDIDSITNPERPQIPLDNQGGNG